MTKLCLKVNKVQFKFMVIGGSKNLEQKNLVIAAIGKRRYQLIWDRQYEQGNSSINSKRQTMETIKQQGHITNVKILLY